MGIYHINSRIGKKGERIIVFFVPKFTWKDFFYVGTTFGF